MVWSAICEFHTHSLFIYDVHMHFLRTYKYKPTLWTISLISIVPQNGVFFDTAIVTTSRAWSILCRTRL